MAEYSANALQTLSGANAPVIFTETPVPCTSGLIFHRDESGVFRLASPAKIEGRVVGGCCCNRRMLYAMYYVDFHANIAVTTGGTAGPISLGVAIDGSVDPSSIMTVPGATVGVFDNVSAGITVAVPAICGCESISIVKVTEGDIDVMNANLNIAYKGTGM